MYGVAPGICACPSTGMPRRCHAAAQRRSNGVRVLSAEWGRASMGAAMNPVGKALWYIESHFAGEITLEEIAGVGGVSRYHMSRAFAAAMDCSLSRYVRGRRLTEAARALANGAPDILSVALDWGYGSHEAFTRAFRDQFGLTPDMVRAQRHLDNLELVEPM